MNGAKRTKLLAVMMLATLAVAGITVLSVADNSDQSDAATTDNLTYTVTGGCLTISGTGVMKDYTSSANLGTLYTFTTCVIESGVTSIGIWAFFNCPSLTSIKISDGVTSIGNYALQSCPSLTSITIPSSVTSIGMQAFNRCINVTSFTFNGFQPTFGNDSMNLGYSESPVTVTIYTIGWGSLSVIPQTVIGSYTTPTYMIADSLSYSVTGGCLYITGTGPMQNYNQSNNMQNKYWGYTTCVIGSGVTSISNYAFYNCQTLTSIIVPSSMKSIGNYAFYSCPSLGHMYCVGSYGSITFGTSVFVGGSCTVSYNFIINETVTFQNNNGTNSTVIVVQQSSVIGVWPADPIKTGYVFTGWYSDSSLTTLFEISTPITADITLYAGFEVSLIFNTEPSAVANVTASVSFDNAISCSAASSTNYNSVVWDFGDGSTSTAIYCIHMYGEPGTYTVTLTAVNDYGSDVTSEEVTVHTVGSNVDGTTTGSELSFLGIVWYVWAIIAAVVAVIVLAKMGVMPL